MREYPWLATPEQLLAEFNRITSVDIHNNFNEFLADYGDKIVEMFNGMKKNKDHFLHMIANARPSEEGEEDNDTATSHYARKCFTLMAVPVILGEDPMSFVGLDIKEPKSAPVFIKCNLTQEFVEQNFFELLC
jgi:hypothetical protein